MGRNTYVLSMAVLLAALLALPGVVQSAMWVGAEIGGNYNNSVDFSYNGRTTGHSEINPSVIGGVTLGYDFVNSGFGAYAWPDWMKYFSFAMDITYNRLVIQDYPPGVGRFFPQNSRLNGYEVAWTFMFMAHYGFLPDTEVPGGRVNPYLGVGPALVWTGVEQSISHQRDDAMNIALVVEPGIRWMVMKNVSIDTALRYRYSQPSYDIRNVTFKADALNQFAALVRASYHF